jgi:glycosyltransferase involved in cell wall biosynthesis
MTFLKETPVLRVIPPTMKVVPAKLKVSAVIITYNEERLIRETLSKLHWCNEIVIVDSFSTDNTVEICKQAGCRIFSRHFDGYGSQKQFAVSKATNDWILCIDADEVLTDELVLEISSLTETDTGYAAFSIPMNLVFLNKEFRYGKESGRHFLRMFNKQRGGFTSDKVHEGIHVTGPVKKMRHLIRHYSYSSLDQYLEKMNRYSSISAELAYKKGRKMSAWAVFFSIPLNFVKYYFIERNILNGAKGFYWSALCSFYTFSKYVKIKEHNKHSQL